MFNEMTEITNNNVSFFERIKTSLLKNMKEEKGFQMLRGSSNETVSTALYNSDEDDSVKENDEEKEKEKLSCNGKSFEKQVGHNIKDKNEQENNISYESSEVVKEDKNEEHSIQLPVTSESPSTTASKDFLMHEQNSYLSSQPFNLAQYANNAAYLNNFNPNLHTIQNYRPNIYHTMHNMHKFYKFKNSLNFLSLQAPKIKIDAPEIFPAMLRKNMGDVEAATPQTIVSYNGKWRLVKNYTPANIPISHSINSLHNTYYNGMSNNANKLYIHGYPEHLIPITYKFTEPEENKEIKNFKDASVVKKVDLSKKKEKYDHSVFLKNKKNMNKNYDKNKTTQDLNVDETEAKKTKAYSFLKNLISLGKN